MENINNVLIDILVMVFVTGGIAIGVTTIICLIKGLIDYFRY